MPSTEDRIRMAQMRYSRIGALSRYGNDFHESEHPRQFDYTAMAKDVWGELQREAHKASEIEFDHENDDAVGMRDIDIPWKQDPKYPCKFNCELRSAGGDWQSPTYYFRVQIVDGRIDGHSQYSNPYFVLIPRPEDGNGNLIKGKDRQGKETGHFIPDEEIQRKSEDRRSENACWKWLKSKLEELCDE